MTDLDKISAAILAAELLPGEIERDDLRKIDAALLRAERPQPFELEPAPNRIYISNIELMRDAELSEKYDQRRRWLRLRERLAALWRLQRGAAS